MTKPGAGADKIFVAPAPEKYLKRLQALAPVPASLPWLKQVRKSVKK